MKRKILIGFVYIAGILITGYLIDTQSTNWIFKGLMPVLFGFLLLFGFAVLSHRIHESPKMGSEFENEQKRMSETLRSGR